MELATITLRLSGQTQNTVVKEKVSPPQLAVYAFMHGEDCVESLKITGIDKKRTIEQEMNRLDALFSTAYAKNSFKRLFPGHAPRLPATFTQVGFSDTGNPAAAQQPIWQGDSAAGDGGNIRDKIRQAADDRRAEAGEAPIVHEHELGDALDNTGGAEEEYEEDEELGDDPLDAEIRNNLQPAPGQE